MTRSKNGRLIPKTADSGRDGCVWLPYEMSRPRERQRLRLQPDLRLPLLGRDRLLLRLRQQREPRLQVPPRGVSAKGSRGNTIARIDDNPQQ